jgi:hypothetical protein
MTPLKELFLVLSLAAASGTVVYFIADFLESQLGQPAQHSPL